MPRHFKARTKRSRGQSLVETALTLPLLIMIVLNVVNLGYFLLVIINLTGAARSSTLYSIEGSYTPYALQEPSAGGASPTTTTGTVAYTVFKDLTGALSNPTGASVQVCSQINTNSATGSGVNGTGSSQVANCVICTSSGGCVSSNGYAGNPAPSADPEAPNFVTNQVDVTYQFNTLFTGRIFNLPLQAFSGICNASGSCTFTRRARMRSMGP